MRYFTPQSSLIGSPVNPNNPELLRRFRSKFAVMDCGYSTPCWVWQRFLLSNGYGQYWVKDHFELAHRYSYKVFIGTILDGLCIDHLCRNRACVNPLHLEPVTQRENSLRGLGIAARLARQTHCKRGHALVGENLLITKQGFRQCRTCRHAAKLIHDATYRAKKRAERADR
jgi:hypothetical protein